MLSISGILQHVKIPPSFDLLRKGMSIDLKAHGEPPAVLLVASAVTRTLAKATRLRFPLPSLASIAGTCKTWIVYEFHVGVAVQGALSRVTEQSTSEMLFLILLFSLRFYNRETKFVACCKVAARSDIFVSFETAMICKFV